MYRMASYRRFIFNLCGSLYGLVVAATWLGCGHPDAAPAFMDPPVACNADLIRGTSYTLVTRQFALPRPTGGHAYKEDYDGNGEPENQLNNLLNLAEIGGFDVGAGLDRVNQAGEGLLLLQLTSPDLAQGQANCASLTIRRAAPPGPGGMPPKFDGTDVFLVASADSFTFYGRIDDMVFQSVRPRDQGPDVDSPLDLKLPLLPGESVLLPLRGVGVTARLITDDQNKIVGLTEGSIHGVQAAGAVRALLMPAVARVLTAAVHRPPSGDWRSSLLTWLEDQKHNKTSQRKCLVAADCCVQSPGTCKILPEEVAESVIGGVLAPDVEVFDPEGNWHPVPSGKALNGFSVGLGFEATGATFHTLSGK